MSALALVQARMSSTRLPGKVLADIEGETMLALLLRRVAAAQRLEGVVVATSEGSDDDPVADAARAAGAGVFRGPLDDVLAVGRELLLPTLVAAETLAEATSVQFPGLTGVLPGLGRMEPNDWGLAFELRDAKSPHWTGANNSERTFGHFGASGTFLWVDPDARVACAVLTGRPFGDWAKEAWPAFSDAVLAEV